MNRHRTAGVRYETFFFVLADFHNDFCVLIIPTSLFSYYAMDRVSKYSEESIAVSKVDNLESLQQGDGNGSEQLFQECDTVCQQRLVQEFGEIQFPIRS